MGSTRLIHTLVEPMACAPPPGEAIDRSKVEYNMGDFLRKLQGISSIAVARRNI